MSLTTVLIIFLPLMLVLGFSIPAIVGARLSNRRLASMESDFGHPIDTDVPIGRLEDGVSARFNSPDGRFPVPYLSIQIKSIEGGDFHFGHLKSSWNERCFKDLCADEAARAAMDELLSMGFDSVELSAGELCAKWAKFNPRLKPIEKFSEKAAKAMATVNEAVLRYFKNERFDQDARVKQRRQRLALLSLFPCLFAPIAGCFLASNYILDARVLFSYALAITLFGAQAFYPRAKTFSKGSENLERMVPALTAAFSFGLVWGLFVIGCTLNILLPQLSSEVRTLPIKRLEKHAGKYGQVFYTARVEDWTHPPWELDFTLNVSPHAANAIRVTISRGALGMGWVSDYSYVDLKSER